MRISAESEHILRKYRAELLEEIHCRQQTLDRIDYCIYESKKGKKLGGKEMKKLTAMLLVFMMTMSLAACGNTAGSSGNNDSAAGDSVAQTEVENGSDAAGAQTPGNSMETDRQEGDNGKDDPAAKDTADGTEAGGNSAGNAGDDAADREDGGKVLVAYFSATNTTEKLAEYMADSLGADLYEIVPQEPYTDADLDYNDSGSRSTLEQDDPSARPTISGGVENMEQYNMVFVGYPIWWGDAPRIVSTFVESYDFSGKTVIPFCTSGGSGIGRSGRNLEALTSGATWLDGARLNSGSSREDIVEWINGLGIEVTAE